MESVEHVPLARRPHRLVIQLPRQEALPWLVDKIRLVRVRPPLV